jgi:hypothetical protein
MKAKRKYGKGGMMKYLKGGQVKLDANKDGKLSSEDFKMLRGEKKYQGGGKVKKSYKKTTLSTKDKDGQFSARTKRTKGARSPYARYDSEYSKKYQNEMVGRGFDSQRIGYQEERMRSKDKFDKSMGLRAEAYQARENKFGVKKPKAKVMKSGGKVVKYQKGGELTVEQRKAKKAAEARKKKELQDKFRKADSRVTREAKQRTESSSKSQKKATGRGLTRDQKAGTMSRLRKNRALNDVQVRDNIKDDLRSIQGGKEELAYVGRPDRYGDLATIKDKMFNTSKNKNGSYNQTRVKNIYNDFEGQGPKGAKLRPTKKRKR